MSSGDERSARTELLAAVRRLDALGLNRGSTGNASVRVGDDVLITPTGAEADTLGADDLAIIAPDGSVRGAWQPSSEWPFHVAIYRSRPDVHAVVHAHSTHATALACQRRPLPAFHYMVAITGASHVPCVPYHTYGSEPLSAAVVDGLRHGNACLLANHGLVACGASIAAAMKVALEVESLCESYLASLVFGEPALLDDDEMARVIEKFKTYGRTQRRG
jgi:L-fuculose-phosphate aldolase